MTGRTVDRENGCYYPTDAEVPERGKSAVAVSTFGTGSEQQERFGDLDLMQIAFVDAGVPDYARHTV